MRQATETETNSSELKNNSEIQNENEYAEIKEFLAKGGDPYLVRDFDMKENFTEFVHEENNIQNNEELMKFYDDRGLLMFFEVHPKENVDTARFRFLTNLIKSFKY